jgi:MaoC like domain
VNDSFLGGKVYDLRSQQAFARLSGDHNPIHLDHIGARRMLTGGLAVHGVHLVLTGVESFLLRRKKSRPGFAITGIRALFLKPALVGEEILFYLAEETREICRLACFAGSDRICEITLNLGTPIDQSGTPPALRKEKIVEADFKMLAKAAGQLPIGLDRTLARKLFPRCSQALGYPVVAELLALTRLVGMRCPGRHSLFSSLAIQWTPNEPSWSLAYQVALADKRFRRLDLKVSTRRLEGKITAFVPPPTTRQPGTSEIAAKVAQGSFASSRALIIGGSRGLGEVTAKIIAAGGGHPIITYHRGRKDATAVAQDIKSAGGTCTLLKLNVLEKASPALQRLMKGDHAPLSVYYFATPRISTRREGFFDYNKLRDFEECYVTAFGRLTDYLAANGSTTLHVFYPSSIFVRKSIREFAEYSMAKQTAENLCAFYNQYLSRIKISVARLPKVRTDQTSTLVAAPAKEGFQVMLPWVRQIESAVSGGKPPPGH